MGHWLLKLGPSLSTSTPASLVNQHGPQHLDGHGPGAALGARADGAVVADQVGSNPACAHGRKEAEAHLPLAPLLAGTDLTVG